MNLFEEIQLAFDKVQTEHNPGDATVQVLKGTEENMPPGFSVMQEFYKQYMTTMVRRAFRHFAGSAMPTNGDELIVLTREQVVPNLMASTLRAFADGVRIAHRNEQVVRMALHYEEVAKLFEIDTYVMDSIKLADELASDDEVGNFFLEYLNGGVDYMSHITGFAHSTDVNPNKVWDLWMLISGATTCSCYLAGYQLGTIRRERDVLEGIARASEADHGSE